VATDGTYLPEFQVAQLRKVFKKATHDAHATGFRADTIRAPSIPPLPRFPGLPGVWADPSTSHPGRGAGFVFFEGAAWCFDGEGVYNAHTGWAPDRPSSPDGAPAYPNPPRPPSPPMQTVASLLSGPLFTPPPPPPAPQMLVQTLCGKGKRRHLCLTPPAPPRIPPLPVGMVRPPLPTALRCTPSLVGHSSSFGKPRGDSPDHLVSRRLRPSRVQSAWVGKEGTWSESPHIQCV